jgi:hypothetical protein
MVRNRILFFALEMLTTALKPQSAALSSLDCHCGRRFLKHEWSAVWVECCVTRVQCGGGGGGGGGGSSSSTAPPPTKLITSSGRQRN